MGYPIYVRKLIKTYKLNDTNQKNQYSVFWTDAKNLGCNDQDIIIKSLWNNIKKELLFNKISIKKHLLHINPKIEFRNWPKDHRQISSNIILRLKSLDTNRPFGEEILELNSDDPDRLDIFTRAFLSTDLKCLDVFELSDNDIIGGFLVISLRGDELIALASAWD